MEDQIDIRNKNPVSRAKSLHTHIEPGREDLPCRSSEFEVGGMQHVIDRKLFKHGRCRKEQDHCDQDDPGDRVLDKTTRIVPCDHSCPVPDQP